MPRFIVQLLIAGVLLGLMPGSLHAKNDRLQTLQKRNISRYHPLRKKRSIRVEGYNPFSENLPQIQTW